MKIPTTSIPSMWTSGTGKRSFHEEERNMETLEDTVRTVYSALKEDRRLHGTSVTIISKRFLPDDICFITSQELEDYVSWT